MHNNTIRNMALSAAICGCFSLLVPTSFAQNGGKTEQRLAALEAAVTQLKGTVQSQQTQISALQSKLQFVTVTGTDMFISGANLHLRNGLDGTHRKNGLGNLTLGYNEDSGFFSRSGSHNLILGRYNNYESFGSIISGEANSAKGDYTSILGSYECYSMENGGSSALIAAFGSATSKEYSAVIAAKDSQANGFLTSVLGGEHNIADGDYSAIVGGSQNKIWFMSSHNAILGGHNNQMWKGICNSISGGYNNEIYGDYSSISGGQGGLVEAFILAGSIAGGNNNTVNNNYSSIGGGDGKTTTANMQFKGGGLTG